MPSRSPDAEGSQARRPYTATRVRAWARGEISLAELSEIAGPEMLEMAVIGYSMYEQGRHEAARVIFQALCALDPKEGYYRTALGAVFLVLERLEDAERMFNEALALNEREIASYVNRGEVYLRQGRILEAARDFKRAVELDPKNRDPLSRRARVLAAAALETLEAARKAGTGTGRSASRPRSGQDVTGGPRRK